MTAWRSSAPLAVIDRRASISSAPSSPVRRSWTGYVALGFHRVGKVPVAARPVRLHPIVEKLSGRPTLVRPLAPLMHAADRAGSESASYRPQKMRSTGRGLGAGAKAGPREELRGLLAARRVVTRR